MNMSKLKTFTKYFGIIYLIFLVLYFFVLNTFSSSSVTFSYVILTVLMFIFGLIDLFHPPRNVWVIIFWIASILSLLYFIWGFFAIWLLTSMFQGA